MDCLHYNKKRELLTMACGQVIMTHWQDDKTLAECNQHMWMNTKFSDVTFKLDYKDAKDG